jgi:hypothetical protein
MSQGPGRVAARGISAGIDSNIDSQDSREWLLNELNETETKLANAKKALKDSKQDAVTL